MTGEADDTGSGPVRVLLVDDVADMRLLLRTVIGRRDGFEVAGEAADGREAVELAASAQPDVVVLDLGLPDLEGREVLTGIRNHSPLSRVVVFSGTRSALAPDLIERVEAFVSKEKNLDILLEVIAELGEGSIPLAELSLTGHAASVAKARAYTEQTLQRWQLTDLVADAVIVVSELVTNAIQHAGSDCELRLSSHPRSVRIAVVDFGPGTPEPQPPSATQTRGRGLHIVDTLSFAWGVDSLAPDHKLVWSELIRPSQRARVPSTPTAS